MKTTASQPTRDLSAEKYELRQAEASLAYDTRDPKRIARHAAAQAALSAARNKTTAAQTPATETTPPAAAPQGHTPTPWNTETCRAPDGLGYAVSIGTQDGPQIAIVLPSETMDEDAALIVARVNGWDALVAERDTLKKQVELGAQMIQGAIELRKKELAALARLHKFACKAAGTCMGVALSGKDHPNPDGALTEIFEEGNKLTQDKAIRAALAASAK